MSAAPIRLLQLVTRRQLRGAEVYAAALSEQLVRRGHQVDFAGLYAPGEPPLDAAGCRVVDLAGRPGRWPSPRLVARLAAEVRRRRPQLVQANGSDTLKLAVAALALVRPRPRLVYRNISVQSRWLRGPLHRAVNRFLIARPDAVVSVSEASRRDLVEVLVVAEERTRVIPRGVELPTEPPDRAAARCRLAALAGADAATGPWLVHVGSFTEEKNHRGLLAVLAGVRREHPGARLVCLGDGLLRDETLAEAGRRGLSGTFHAPGARPDAADLAAGGDLLVLFSSIEGLPGVVLEAGARRLPVVATAVGGVGEVVRDGVDGLLVAAGDEAGCTAAVCRLLADQELAARLAASLERRVAERFSLAATVDAYEALYHGLLAGEVR